MTLSITEFSKSNKNLYRIAFIILCLIFTGLKIGDLMLPYYWDELGVYSQASLYFFDNGPSLLPGSMPPVLSRGHPLLYMFLFGWCFKLFGTSILTAHIFSFVISLLFLGVGYLIAEKFFSPLVAFLATLMVVVQPIFYAQSVFVLPEIMLGLFSLLALYYYLNNSFWLCAIMASLALQTKETGIYLPVLFLIGEGLKYYNSQCSGKEFVKRIAILFLPIYTFLIFIIIQRIQNGWFFFPYHTGFISFNPDTMYWRFIGYVRFLFLRQGRVTWLVVLLVTIGVFVYRNRKNLKEIFAIKGLSEKSIQIIVLVFYILGALGYSLLNFPLNRYILMLYPILTLLIILMINYLISDWRIVSGVVVAMMLMTLFFINGRHTRVIEDDLSYREMVLLQKKVVGYFSTVSDTNVIVCSFPVHDSFRDPRLGYVSRSAHTIYSMEEDGMKIADYAIFNTPGNLDDMKLDTTNFSVVQEMNEGRAKAFILKRKQGSVIE